MIAVREGNQFLMKHVNFSLILLMCLIAILIPKPLGNLKIKIEQNDISTWLLEKEKIKSLNPLINFTC